MRTLVDVFGELIQPDWRIERKDADWLIRESNKTKNPELTLTGAPAIGFSLDRQGKSAWPFLLPLPGMLSVCDAVMVTVVGDRGYVLAVEMKSTNTTRAAKQIRSCWHLMEWLRALLELNGHWRNGWCFCGLVSSTPRRQERKGTTRRGGDLEVTKGGPYPTVHARNQRRINLIDVDNALTSAKAA